MGRVRAVIKDVVAHWDKWKHGVPK